MWKSCYPGCQHAEFRCLRGEGPGEVGESPSWSCGDPMLRKGTLQRKYNLSFFSLRNLSVCFPPLWAGPALHLLVPNQVL